MISGSLGRDAVIALLTPMRGHDPVLAPLAPTCHKELHMAQVTATIASKVGLHARPAATFVKAVAEKGIPVTIAKEGGAAVDASSILGASGPGPAHAHGHRRSRCRRRPP